VIVNQEAMFFMLNSIIRGKQFVQTHQCAFDEGD